MNMKKARNTQHIFNDKPPKGKWDKMELPDVQSLAYIETIKKLDIYLFLRQKQRSQKISGPFSSAVMASNLWIYKLLGKYMISFGL